MQCKFLNAIFECNDIVIFIYSHYPLDPNATIFDTKCVTLSIKYFCIRIKRVITVRMYMKITMSLHSNLAFRNLQCMQLISFFSKRKQINEHAKFSSVYLIVVHTLSGTYLTSCFCCWLA